MVTLFHSTQHNMRSKSSIGAFVAASFLGQSFAQAPEYGDSGGSPAQGSELNTYGGSSATSTCGAEKTTTVFVTVPTGSGNPSESQSGDQNPGHSEHTVTRILQSTVFVSDGIPHSSSGPFLSAGPPSQSTLSSAPSISGSGIKPFTTITIDIWGTGSDPAHGSNTPGTGSATDFQPTASTQGDSATSTYPPESTSQGDSATSASPPDSASQTDSATNPWSTVTVVSSGATHRTSLSTQASQGVSTLSNTDAVQTSAPTAYDSSYPGTENPAPTVVTDTDVYWTIGADGPTQVTALSSYTLTTDEPSISAPEASTTGDALPGGRVTVTGADGKPTVIINASTISEGDGPEPTATESSLPLPDNTLPGGKTTVTGADGKPTVIINASAISEGNGPEPTAAESSLPLPGNTLPGGKITVTGSDGKPTVIINGGDASGAGPTQTAAQPSSILDNNLPGGRTTVTGADGKPTVIINGGDSGAVGPTPTATQPSDNNLPGGRITVTGADGEPTVIINGGGISGGVEPEPTPAQTLTVPGNALPGGKVTITGTDGNPTVIINGGGISGDGAATQTAPQSSILTPGNNLPGGRVTITGTDGKPTVVIDAGHISGGDGTPPTASQSAPTIPSSQVYGSGDSGYSYPFSGGPSSAVITGGIPKTTFTVIGTDGLPTVVESTLATPGNAPSTGILPFPTNPPLPGSASGISGGIPTYFPSSAIGNGDIPQTTFTVIGTDGLPTIVTSPFDVPGTGSLPYPTNAPMPGWPASGFPGWPSTNLPPAAPQSGITTQFTFTYIGGNGLPTQVESTVVLSPTDQASNGAIPTIPVPRPGSSDGFPSSGGVTTCYSYTVLGPNGLPTVVESTVVIPTAVPVTTPPLGLPTQLPQGFPTVGEITSTFSYTFTGIDGRPTVLETTIVATPTNPVPGFPGVCQGP
uniref:Uncharacterized protein n=1 Tax=Bionectria ochroleuca TaxID=29856 RepID=A0A8H7K6R5_BIOOC